VEFFTETPVNKTDRLHHSEIYELEPKEKNRTLDIRVTKAALYQLSYSGKYGFFTETSAKNCPYFVADGKPFPVCGKRSLVLRI
jgi:hypothetical protein